jgi:hypothetical protein
MISHVCYIQSLAQEIETYNKHYHRAASLEALQQENFLQQAIKKTANFSF